MKFDILKPQSISSTGKKAIQEDCMYPVAGEGTIHDKLFVLCDGAGDDGKGYTAAEYFSRTVSDYFFQSTCSDEPLSDEILREALFTAKEKLEERCPESAGTAFALLYMHRHGCLAAHVGDCRIYHIRPQDKQLLYRSKDDSRLFSPSDTRLQEPVKCVITDVKYGDYFVMMSKGAHQAFTDRELTDIISEPVNDKTKLLRIVKLIGDATDNYSVNIVHVSGVMNEAIDESLFQNETLLMDNYKEQSAAAASASALASASASPASNKPAQPSPSKAADSPRPAQPSKAKEGAAPSASPSSQNRRAATSPVEPQEPAPTSKPRKKREFPIVTVTAGIIVALGIWLWIWGQGQKSKPEEEAPVEVKKKQEKDTFNIIKNEKLHAVQGEEQMKPQEKTEEEKKKEEEEKARKQAEKAAEEASEKAENGEGQNPAPDAGQTPSAPAASSTAAPAITTPPATTTPSTTPPPAPAQQPAKPAAKPSTTQPTSSGAVTPKPVIPEGE